MNNFHVLRNYQNVDFSLRCMDVLAKLVLTLVKKMTSAQAFGLMSGLSLIYSHVCVLVTEAIKIKFKPNFVKALYILSSGVLEPGAGVAYWSSVWNGK